ncbi:SIMPL domain-containing protein [Pseudomonas aeruginosa]|nr:SIMPL domain-containing protein [Pseudomonas aeruginosa]
MSAISRPAAAVTLCAASLSAVAEEAPRYNQVSLHAEVSQQVAHDLMQVTLYSENQGSDPAKLAAETTSVLQRRRRRRAQGQGRDHQPGQSQQPSGLRRQGPEDHRLARARRAAPGKLRLRRPRPAPADLLGKLKMGGMDFQHRRCDPQEERGPIDEGAVDAFKERAQLLTEALGGKGYKLVSLSVNSAGAPRPYPVMRMAAMKADASFGGAPRRRRSRPGPARSRSTPTV